MTPQSSTPLYPGFIVAADIALAGVLFLIAPGLGVLMGVAAVSVLGAVVLGARGHRWLALRPATPGNGSAAPERSGGKTVTPERS